MSNIANNEKIVNDDSVIKLDFRLVRDGCGYTPNEYKTIKKYLEEGRYKDAIEKIYQYAAEKEKSYNKQITGPENFLPLLSKYAFDKIEKFIVFTVDGSHRVIGEYVTSIGTANKALAHPRDIFKTAINDNATAIFIAHNHPSGSTVFSSEDNALTERMKDAGNLLGIDVLDHILVGYNDEKRQIFVRSSVGDNIYYGNIHNKSKEHENER